MEIRELFLSLISFAIFIWGIATKRYGTASIIIFLLLIFANNLFVRDVAIVSLVALIILDGKRKGKDSIFSKYNIYSKDCILSKRAILVISLIGVAVSVFAVIGCVLEKR